MSVFDPGEGVGDEGPDEATRARFSEELKVDFGRVMSMLNAQVRSVVYFQQIGKRIILSDPYFRHYVFGAFDGATAKWGLVLRQRLSFMLEFGFVGYLSGEFCQDKELAQKLFKEVWDSNNEEPTNPAIVAGGTDAFELLKGATPPMRLARHYGFDLEAAASKADVAGFKRYFDQQQNCATL